MYACQLVTEFWTTYVAVLASSRTVSGTSCWTPFEPTSRNRYTPGGYWLSIVTFSDGSHFASVMLVPGVNVGAACFLPGISAERQMNRPPVPLYQPIRYAST